MLKTFHSVFLTFSAPLNEEPENTFDRIGKETILFVHHSSHDQTLQRSNCNQKSS